MTPEGKHIFHHHFQLSKSHRNLLMGHRSFVVWLTGLSGAGKSTIANAVEMKLYNAGYATYVLDGDNIRKRLNSDLGFSEEARKENIRRAGEVCRLMVDAGVIVIAAFITPLQREREFLKNVFANDYVEIYIKCPLEVCEQRDVKGLYQKARAGEIPNFTGITSVYEEPCHPHITIDTSELDIEAAAEIVYDYVMPKVILD